MLYRCILGSYAFILFWGIIGIYVLPSLLIYYIIYPFTKYPQDTFQALAASIYKIFFKLVPKINLKLDLLDDVPQSAIYVSSHQSSLDYPVVGSFIKKYIILTNINIYNIPFISLVSRLIGVRHLNKKNLDEVNKTYSELEMMLAQNRNVILFPEGTRHVGKKLCKFKKGAFRLAMKTNKPLIPIVIEGSALTLPKRSRCYATTAQTTLHVKMLSPIYPENFESEKELLEYTQNVIQKQKDILSDVTNSHTLMV